MLGFIVRMVGFVALFAFVIWANAEVQSLVVDLDDTELELEQCRIELASQVRSTSREKDHAAWRVHEAQKLVQSISATEVQRSNELLRARDEIKALRADIVAARAAQVPAVVASVADAVPKVIRRKKPKLKPRPRRPPTREAHQMFWGF